jgi:ribosomal protein S18 acetylase RimI-like enzyme
VIRTLTREDFDALHAAFLAAFSDYVVKFALTHEQLAEMLTRRGWVPGLSVGAFEDGSLVAFTLNCVEGDRAYDTGTGVIPTHRRRGLARELMERSFELLGDRCSTYVLEVLEPNAKAVELYRATGFEVVRTFQCWSYESSSRRVDESSSGIPRRLDDSTTGRLPFDVEPSWQNSNASIARAKAPRVILGDENGYAIVFPDRGDLAQLVVHGDARRRGLGAQLLEAAAQAAGKPLAILNVDESDAGIAAFLERAGAKRTVRQLEMVRALQPRDGTAHGPREHTRSRR